MEQRTEVNDKVVNISDLQRTTPASPEFKNRLLTGQYTKTAGTLTLTNTETMQSSDSSVLLKQGVSTMNDREYVDAKINALETNMNQKIQAQGELFTERLRHIETKLDSNQSILMAKLDTISNNITQQQEIFKRDVEIITETKINALKENMRKEQNETKKHMWQIGATVAAIASLIIAALQFFTS